MTPVVSGLIRANVRPHNAKKIEQECHSELCRAHAEGDLSDLQALRGKIAICRQIQEESCPIVRSNLAELLDLWKDDDEE